jgi:hypothetical protein
MILIPTCPFDDADVVWVTAPLLRDLSVVTVCHEVDLLNLFQYRTVWETQQTLQQKLKLVQ